MTDLGNCPEARSVSKTERKKERKFLNLGRETKDRQRERRKGPVDCYRGVSCFLPFYFHGGSKQRRDTQRLTRFREETGEGQEKGLDVDRYRIEDARVPVEIRMDRSRDFYRRVLSCYQREEEEEEGACTERPPSVCTVWVTERRGNKQGDLLERLIEYRTRQRAEQEREE